MESYPRDCPLDGDCEHFIYCRPERNTNYRDWGCHLIDEGGLTCKCTEETAATIERELGLNEVGEGIKDYFELVRQAQKNTCTALVHLCQLIDEMSADYEEGT